MYIITASKYRKQKNRKGEKEKIIITIFPVRQIQKIGYLFNVVQMIRPTFHILNGKTLKALFHSCYTIPNSPLTEFLLCILATLTLLGFGVLTFQVWGCLCQRTQNSSIEFE